MGVIIFNGISSQDYNIQVEHPPGYTAPEKDYEIIHVPGKNGDIVINKGSFKNVVRTYEIAIGSLEKEFFTMANYISEWLNSASGYARLEDSYEPECYRLALFEQSIEIENILNHAGRATISFNCKPQRFLKNGDESVHFSSSGIIRNPTHFNSLPIITIFGSGEGVLRIGDDTVKISNIGNCIVINSEIQDAYEGTINKNSYISLNNGFPKLGIGENEISFSGGITHVEVIPKWWTL